MVPARIPIEFFPGDRRRNRGALAGPRRIGHHCRRSSLITEPIEENAPLTLDLANISREHFRLCLGNRAAKSLGKGGHGRPVLRSIQGSDNVETLAAGEQWKGPETEILEQCA